MNTYRYMRTHQPHRTGILFKSNTIESISLLIPSFAWFFFLPMCAHIIHIFIMILIDHRHNISFEMRPPEINFIYILVEYWCDKVYIIIIVSYIVYGLNFLLSHELISNPLGGRIKIALLYKLCNIRHNIYFKRKQYCILCGGDEIKKNDFNENLTIIYCWILSISYYVVCIIKSQCRW